MSRRHFFVKLLPVQVKELEKFISDSFCQGNLRARRRGQAIWHSNNGWNVTKISQQLKVSERIIWTWLKTYQVRGLDGLKGERFFKRLPSE